MCKAKEVNTRHGCVLTLARYAKSYNVHGTVHCWFIVAVCLGPILWREPRLDKKSTGLLAFGETQRTRLSATIVSTYRGLKSENGEERPLFAQPDLMELRWRYTAGCLLRWLQNLFGLNNGLSEGLATTSVTVHERRSKLNTQRHRS